MFHFFDGLGIKYHCSRFWIRRRRYLDLINSIFIRIQAVHHLDLSITLMIFCILISGCNLFLYCYYGKHATDSYAAFSDCLFECNWMMLPVDLQKCFLPMIRSAQKPLSFHGYNMVNLNLNLFGQVTNQKMYYYFAEKTFLILKFDTFFFCEF